MLCLSMFWLLAVCSFFLSLLESFSTVAEGCQNAMPLGESCTCVDATVMAAQAGPQPMQVWQAQAWETLPCAPLPQPLPTAIRPTFVC